MDASHALKGVACTRPVEMCVSKPSAIGDAPISSRKLRASTFIC